MPIARHRTDDGSQPGHGHTRSNRCCAQSRLSAFSAACCARKPAIRNADRTFGVQDSSSGQIFEREREPTQVAYVVGVRCCSTKSARGCASSGAPTRPATGTSYGPASAVTDGVAHRHPLPNRTIPATVGTSRTLVPCDESKRSQVFGVDRAAAGERSAYRGEINIGCGQVNEG